MKTANENTREIVIPFSGFYESLHSGAVDYAIESLFMDDRGNTNAGLVGRAVSGCDFFGVCREYAKRYAREFSTFAELPSLSFKVMQSPREYNFTTDRIFCTISDDDVQKMHNETSQGTLWPLAREWFTSRDGFSSFYDPDVTAWGDVTAWDHNQLACLLAAYIAERECDDFDQWAEVALMEAAQCNGDFDNWLGDNVENIDKLWRVHSYLQRREERAAA